jgi:hypothetical protein
VEDITAEFWENRMEQIRVHITQNGIILLKFFYGKERTKGATAKTGRGKSTMEILCWRFKRKERWDDYMSYYEEAINKHLQNMHLVCDSGNGDESLYCR